jgi:hypothetical protein
MNLADHGVAGHVAELTGDLARAQAVDPKLLEKLDPLIGPSCTRICHFITCLHRRQLLEPRIPHTSRTEIGVRPRCEGHS